MDIQTGQHPIERDLTDRRTAMRRVAIFGAITTPAMLALLKAEQAIAASGDPGPGGGGGGDTGGPPREG